MAGLHVVGPSMKMLFNMIMHLLCDETSSVISKKLIGGPTKTAAASHSGSIVGPSELVTSSAGSGDIAANARKHLEVTNCIAMPISEPMLRLEDLQAMYQDVSNVEKTKWGYRGIGYMYEKHGLILAVKPIQVRMLSCLLGIDAVC
jgi:hypothetical protein